ncbi:hypothetical protein [Helicobacter sp. T3_23-1056]
MTQTPHTKPKPKKKPQKPSQHPKPRTKTNPPKKSKSHLFYTIFTFFVSHFYFFLAKYQALGFCAYTT